jgi:hypothetical protein
VTLRPNPARARARAGGFRYPFGAAEDRRLAAAVEVATTAYDTAEG